ncbi:MAG: hypothetical protein IJV93_11400 [Lentisphaeria bacterium]|nr:hypothetical protein [Lentisphaeria bacterium]
MNIVLHNAGAAHLLKSITSAPFRSATSAAREGAWGREALAPLSPDTAELLKSFAA